MQVFSFTNVSLEETALNTCISAQEYTKLFLVRNRNITFLLILTLHRLALMFPSQVSNCANNTASCCFTVKITQRASFKTHPLHYNNLDIMDVEVMQCNVSNISIAAFKDRAIRSNLGFSVLHKNRRSCLLNLQPCD